MLHQENLWQNRNSRFTCAKITAIMCTVHVGDGVACTVCILAHLQSNVYLHNCIPFSKTGAKSFSSITHIRYLGTSHNRGYYLYRFDSGLHRGFAKYKLYSYLKQLK